MDAAQRLSELTDLVTPFAIQAASELAVPDALAKGPRSLAELADELGCHAPSLRRLLRTLSHKEIFREIGTDVFELAPLGQLLRSDHPVSLREANLPWFPNVISLDNLAFSVRTGRTAFEDIHGANLWQYLAANPADGERFASHMHSISRFETESLLQAYDWGSVRTVADIGGGDGILLDLLLSRHPGLTGTLFELPQLACRPTVDGRFSVVAGDFFVDDLPRGHDIYVLKRILYGFSDDEVRMLLGNLRKAMAAGLRLLVVEPFTGAGAVSYFTYRVDLLMLAVPGGRVRSADELTALLGEAGFAVDRMLASATPAIEARAI